MVEIQRKPKGLTIVSITALSSAYAGPQRGAVPPPASAGRTQASASASASSTDAAPRSSISRRHPLMDAMLSATSQRERASSEQAVESSAAVQDALKSDSGAADAAVAHFAHALMEDLRQLAGNGEAKGWNDLSSSVGALAAKAAAGVGAEADAQAAAEAAIPPQPNPLTPMSAAVHLMQVPSSHLLKAYAAMRLAMPQAEPAADSPSAQPVDERAHLAEFLSRMSKSLEPQASATPGLNGLGTMVNTSA